MQLPFTGRSHEDWYDLTRDPGTGHGRGKIVFPSWPGPVLQERHVLAIGKAARRAERASLVESVLGKSQASAGLDLLELTEYAWHDCYKEITPPDDVILNILICSRGDLATMIRAANLAVRDWRDLYLWAQTVQNEQQ